MQGFRMVDGGSSYWNGEGGRAGRKRERRDRKTEREQMSTCMPGSLAGSEILMEEYR